MHLGARLTGAPRRLRRLLRTLSLRARLLLGLIGVVVIGLVVADVVVYQQIDSYLSAQIDQELTTIQPGYCHAVASTIDCGDHQVPTGTFIVVYSQGGQVVASSNSAVHLAVGSATVSQLFSEVSAAAPGAANLGIFGASASGPPGSSGQYRVLPQLIRLYESSATAPFVVPTVGLELIALPLSNFSGTLHQLVFVDLAVTAAVIAALILLGYLVVRLGLRPLEDIEETAGAIAAGELSRRIEEDNPRTEVGRLGASLNSMLAQIEHAFSEQRASETRLRQFLADASHELRTPVTSIRGYSELFRRGAASRPEDLALAMRRIEDEAIRMGVLVDDLLLLARLDQGRPFDLGPVDLSELVTDAAADAQVLAPTREISVDAPAPVIVNGDGQRLRQVVMNLFQNALRHTPDATAIEASVTTRGGVAVLAVTDHGEGISPEHIAHVFERFYRADPSRTRGSGGAGLGLSIVASITEAHHGTVRVESVPGAGATFVVELPLLAAAEPVPDIAADRLAVTTPAGAVTPG